jgi:transposase
VYRLVRRGSPAGGQWPGLAPVARESGTWRGKSFIRGGRAHVRQALYMPALVAIRFNEAMKTKSRSLTQADKPGRDHGNA